MNLYIENAGFIKNIKTIDNYIKKTDIQSCLDLHIIAYEHLGAGQIFALKKLYKQIRKIELIILFNKLSLNTIMLANRMDYFSIKIIVNKEIDSFLWNRICKLKRIIYIYDISDKNSFSVNLSMYEKNRYVVYKSYAADKIDLMNIYFLNSCVENDSCKYSSCMGNTVYISKNGVISFCPKYSKQSVIGNLKSCDGIFEDINFKKALRKIIKKRDLCKKKCIYFFKCRGGCLFEKGCENFPDKYKFAEKDIENIIDSNTDLCELPFFKEIAVIYKLFRVKK